MLTITLASKHKEWHASTTTYTISISTNGHDHNIVFKRLMSDLTMLSSTSNFYCDAAEGNIPAGVVIISYIADSPKKRIIIGQALGNGL
jgi:hypothetical protein